MTEIDTREKLWDYAYLLENMADFMERMEKYFIENPITDSCEMVSKQLSVCKDLARKIAKGECEDERADIELLFDTVKQQIGGWWN